MQDCMNREQMELASASTSAAVPAATRRGPVAALIAAVIVAAALLFAMPSLAYASNEASGGSQGTESQEILLSRSDSSTSVNKTPDEPKAPPAYTAQDAYKSTPQSTGSGVDVVNGAGDSSDKSYTPGDDKSSINDKDSDSDSDSASNSGTNGTEDTDDSTSNEEQDPSDPKDNDDSTDKNNGAISDSTDEIATDKNQSAHPTGDDSKADDVIATPGDKGSADLTAGATSVKTEEVKQQTNVSTQSNITTQASANIVFDFAHGWTPEVSDTMTKTTQATDIWSNWAGKKTWGCPTDPVFTSTGKRLSYTVKVNGEPVQSELKDGYFCIDRRWKKGDKVAVHFDMEPRTVKANNKVEADRGRIAVERGPIVYCAEWPDNDFDVLSVFMNRTPQFEVVEKPDLLYGINQLKTDAQILGYDDRGRLTATDVKLTLIPYYAWAHRGAGAMAVWLPQELSASRPTMPATLASESKVDASHKVKSISAINDRLVPKDENDRSVPYYHWWPKQGTTEWISYEFPSEATVSSATVYWYDDAPWGGCRIPQSWKVYYKDAQGQWQPVSGADKYGVEKGTGNTVNFDPVKTKAVKLEIVQPADNSSGLFEWEVK